MFICWRVLGWSRFDGLMTRVLISKIKNRNTDEIGTPTRRLILHAVSLLTPYFIPARGKEHSWSRFGPVMFWSVKKMILI